MRLNADRLGTEGFRIELPSAHSEAPNVIELGPSRGVSGDYIHTAERIDIRGVRGVEFGVRAFDWHFASGSVHLDGGATLKEVLVDLGIDRTADGSGLSGSIAGGSGELGRAVFHFGAFEVAASVRLEGFEYVAAPDGELLLKAASIELRETNLLWDGGSATIGALDLRHVQLRLKGDQRTLEIQGATLGAVRATLGATTAEIHGGAIPRGLRWSDDVVELGELLADRIVIEVADVSGIAPEPELPKVPPPEAEAETRSGTAPIDLEFLDGLHGQIDIDLRVVTDIAVVGRRDKTHHFRVPVRQGEVNYRSLERDLGTLEDAFIDIEVRHGKLSIENDIPLLPFYYRSLILFRIPPGEVERAENDRMIKLRHFAEWELPPSDESKKSSKKRKKSSGPVDIVALDFENVELSLGLDREAHIELGNGSLHLGGPEESPLGAFTLRGAMRWRPKEEPQPGELEATVDGVTFGLKDLKLGDRWLTVQRAHLDAIESAKQEMSGLRPGRLRVEARGLDLEGLTLADQEPERPESPPQSAPGAENSPEDS
jgi:hypothetical protein